MNLLQIRTKFRELSGRFDLVNDDYSDNGADFFINEGRKFLDRLDETQKSWASAFRFIDIDEFSVHSFQCRAIKEVWAASITSRWQLEKKNLQDLIAGYLTSSSSERSTGTPYYYSPTITRYAPGDATADDIDFESFVEWVDIPSGNSQEYNAILLNTPVDEKLVIEIKGLFYSTELLLDTDVNYWSVTHPMLLCMAAMRQVEIINRNTQGVNDWTNVISSDMRSIGMDLVEELIAEVSQIED